MSNQPGQLSSMTSVLYVPSPRFHYPMKNYSTVTYIRRCFIFICNNCNFISGEYRIVKAGIKHKRWNLMSNVFYISADTFRRHGICPQQNPWIKKFRKNIHIYTCIKEYIPLYFCHKSIVTVAAKLYQYNVAQMNISNSSDFRQNMVLSFYCN